MPCFLRLLLVSITTVALATVAQAAPKQEAKAPAPRKDDAVPKDAPAGSKYWTPRKAPKRNKPTPSIVPRTIPRSMKPVQAPATPPTAPRASARTTKDLKPKNADGHGWHLGVEGRSDVPILMGAHIVFEIPAGLRITSTFGILPPFYVDLINAVLIGAEAYNQQTGDVIKEILSSSMVWRLHLGWRPFAKFGFYIEAGYGLITLGGTSSNTQLLASAVGQSIPPQLQGQLGTYVIKSSLHMLDAEIGYRWLFANNRLLFRIAIGFAGTLGSQTEVKPQSNPNPVSNQFAAKAAEYLDNLYRSFVFTPTVSIGFGYRFF